MSTRTWFKRRPDRFIAGALFAGYLTLLLGSAGSLGFMRDEGFYFAAARSYAQWFELLASEPVRALSRPLVDHHWAVNHEHPALLKSLFALSYLLLGDALGQVSLAFRLPAMLLSSLAVALTFVWGRERLGRAGGLVAALSFGLMPRVFFHAHLACFDLPVCAAWLVTSYLYARSLRARSWRSAIAVGVAYGLFLETKHNAWLFPFVLLLHFGLTQGPLLWAELRARGPWWQRLPRAWLAMLLVSPCLFYALWPWLWHDTFERLRAYAEFHLHHDYYNMEFLGRTYWKPPMPGGYAWVMTAATVPLVTLSLSAVGALVVLSGFRRSGGEATAQAPSARSDHVLWGLSLLMSYAPWLSSETPIFGGTKHWLTAYPFLCLLAGLGFVRVRRACSQRLPRLAGAPLLVGCVLLGPLVMTLHSHPFGLSAYTPLVGGAPGAASLGLNRTFWGYTTQSLAPFIDQNAPPHGRVYVHDTALQSFAMFQQDGRLRADLRGTLNIAASDVALYHHEPHMSRVEHQIWIAYGKLSPDALVAFDGVPIAWAYRREGR